MNGLLREARALPQLVKHDEWNYHLHATPPAAPLATRMAVEAAMAIVDVVRSDELSRLRICASPTCSNVVVDLSKNRSKRFCEGGCGNRAAVAAYRARRSGQVSEERSESEHPSQSVNSSHRNRWFDPGRRGVKGPSDRRRHAAADRAEGRGVDHGRAGRSRSRASRSDRLGQR